MAFFEGVDVLLILAGGFPVITLEELVRIAETVKPKLVVPMHFRTLCYKPQEMFFITETPRTLPEGPGRFCLRQFRRTDQGEAAFGNSQVGTGLSVSRRH